MPFTIVRQDITRMHVDAIVNAANTRLQMGGGVCGAIFHAAGAERMQRACDAVAPIRTGEAAITPGFDLPARFVIHAAGPIYHQWSPEESQNLLRSAYLESLRLAEKNGCESIAFPLISSGIYGYPKAEALRVATDAIRDFLENHEMSVFLAVFDRDAFAASRQMAGDIESYIDQHYVDARRENLRRRLEEGNIDFAPQRPCPIEKEEPDGCILGAAAECSAPLASLDARMREMDAPFSEMLFRLIDRKGKSDVEVYKRANIDRKLFSKIRSLKGYTPKKQTILALAIALELTLEETDDLLERAGYALSHASKFDVIVEYFIINGRFDIFEINETLFQYDQPLLGA